MEKDSAVKYTDAQLKALESRLKREYGQAAKEVSEKLETYLKKFEEKDAKKREQLKAGRITGQEYMDWRYGQMMTGKRWKAMQETLTQDLVNVDKTAAQMMNDTLPQVYAENSNYGTYIAETGANIDTSFTLYSKDTVRALAESDEISLPAASVNIAKDKKWIAKNVNSAVLQGVLQGESIDKIAKRLYNVTDMNRKASVRNARTLVTSAENQGRTDSFKRAEGMGIKMEQGWLATLDNRTRHSHRQMDGEWIKIGAKFSNGLRYPGDASGRPEEVYNCRCTLIGRVNGVEMDLTDLSQRNTTHMQGMSYEEWKQAKSEKENERKQVDGKDITKTFQYNPDAKAPESTQEAFNGRFQKEAMLQIADVQGYNKAPTVVSKAEFNNLVKEHGNISFRTVGDNDDEGREFCRQFMYDDNIAYNYGGGRSYGDGLYIATANSTAQFLNKDFIPASNNSWGYGYNQMAIVMDKNIKLAHLKDVKEKIATMTDDELSKYGTAARWQREDCLATRVAAAEGYDGIIADTNGAQGDSTEYVTIFNRTKLYVCDEVASRDDVIDKW